MSTHERRLITATAFRAMARRGANVDDLADVAVVKNGGLRLKIPAAAAATLDVGFVLSTATIDREGDSISVSGWSDDDFVATGGPVLWAHDHSGLTIAKSGKPYVAGARYCAVGSFTPQELNPFGYAVYRMLTAPPPGPFLNSCSVGFAPTEWEMGESGVNFTKQTLIEWSVTPCPANPEAIVIARSRGIDVAPLQHFYESALDLYHFKGNVAATQREQINRLRILSDPKGRKFFSMLGELKLPKRKDASAVDQSVLLSIDGLTVQAGTSLSTISDTVRSLMAAPAPALPTGSTTGDVETNVQAELQTIVTESENVMAAITSIHGLASAQLGSKSTARTSPAINRTGLRRAVDHLRTIVRMTKSGRVLSAENEAKLRQAVEAIAAVLAKLDQDPEDDKEIVVDGQRIEDDPNDILAGLGISEAELNSILVDIIVEQIAKGVMNVTGLVDLG